MPNKTPLTWVSVNLAKSSKEIQKAFNERQAAQTKLVELVTKATANKAPEGSRIVLTGSGRETLSYAFSKGKAQQTTTGGDIL